MVDPIGILAMLHIPLSIGGAIALLIEVAIISIVIVLLDYVIAHEIDVKDAFIIGLGAYFITPLAVIALGLANYFDPLVAGYVIPLIVWLALSEVLLKGHNPKKKAMVAVAAFVVYTVLNFVGVPMIIAGMIPF